MADEPQLRPVIGAKVDVDRAMTALAERQHGLVARSQLTVLGIGRRAIGHRIERGRLQVIHRGVYAVGHRPTSPQSRIIGAVLLGGPGAVSSHRSAGWLWGLLPYPAVVDVAVGRRRESRPRIRFHHLSPAADEITIHEAIPVTTVPRTIFDLAAIARPRQVERAIHEAEVQRLTDPLSLADMLDRYPRHRGAATVRTILARNEAGLDVTRSELEERFLSFLDRAGIERPRMNAALQVNGCWIEVDCLWEEQRLIVELDGRAAHGTTRGFERDRSRDRELQAAGWRVVRITWRQLHEDERTVAVDLRRLLAA